MSVKITGYYQLPNHKGPQLVDFDEVFETSFMRRYTKFRSFDKFLNGGKFRITSQQDFEALPEEIMDAHVRATTRFSSWQEMLDVATDKYVLHQSISKQD